MLLPVPVRQVAGCWSAGSVSSVNGAGEKGGVSYAFGRILWAQTQVNRLAGSLAYCKIHRFNTQFLVFDAQFLVFDTQFLVLSAKFIIFTHSIQLCLHVDEAAAVTEVCDFVHICPQPVHRQLIQEVLNLCGPELASVRMFPIGKQRRSGPDLPDGRVAPLIPQE